MEVPWLCRWLNTLFSVPAILLNILLTFLIWQCSGDHLRHHFKVILQVSAGTDALLVFLSLVTNSVLLGSSIYCCAEYIQCIQIVITGDTHTVMLSNGLLGGISPSVSHALLVANTALSVLYLVVLPMQFLYRHYTMLQTGGPASHQQGRRAATALVIHISKYLLPCMVVTPPAIYAFCASYRPTGVSDPMVRRILNESGWLPAADFTPIVLLADRSDPMGNVYGVGTLFSYVYAYIIIVFTEWRIAVRLRSLTNVSSTARGVERSVQWVMLAYAGVPLAQLILMAAVPLLLSALSSSWSAYTPLVFLSFSAGLLVNALLTLAFIRPYRRAVLNYLQCSGNCRGPKISQSVAGPSGGGAVRAGCGVNITRVGPMTVADG